MAAPPAVDVRVNTLLPLAGRVEAALRARGPSLPWSQCVFRLDDGADRLDDGAGRPDDGADRPDDGADPQAGVGHSLEYRLGALYVQARATTLAVAVLDPQPGDLVLDLAAAPGGKATQIAAALGNTGLLLANEPRARRVSPLVGNLERCGAHNTLVTSAPGAHLARWFHNAFDRVLLDAPCSGDGIVCKDRGMLAWWSPQDARHKSIQQVGLLRAAFHMLRPGGRLVYSTCSLSTEENEDVLVGLLKRFPEQVDILPVAALAGGRLDPQAEAAWPAAVRRGVRVWPHAHDTEGAFVARISKRAAAEGDKAEGDAGAALLDAAGCPGADVEGWGARLAERWDFAPPVPVGHELVAERGHLHLRPAGAARLAGQPWFVRAGMRLAGLHKGHFYLSQQAVALWGHQVRQRRLDLTWPQVQTLFRGEVVSPAPAAPLPGEVVCVYDDIPLCRAVVAGDGSRLAGYVPRSARTSRLHRLVL